MRKRAWQILFLVIALKGSYFLFYEATHDLFQGYEGNWNRNFINLFSNHDSGWYDQIATDGYKKIVNPRDIGYTEGSVSHQTSWPFFPGYPLLVKGMMLITGQDFNHAAFPLSLLFCFTAFFSFYVLNIKVLGADDKTAFYRTLVFSILPFNYYFSMNYTEAPFFTIVALCFIFIKENKLWLVSLLLIPLVIMRTNGSLLCIPLYLYFLETRERSLFKMDADTFFKSFYFITAPLTFGAYCLYQKHMTGMYFAFSAAQAGFYRETMLPFLSLFRSGELASQFNSIYVIVFVVLIIIFRKKFPLSFNMLMWLSIILPLCSGSTIAVQRYIVPIFPFTIILCDLLANIKPRAIVWVVLVVLHFAAFSLWIIGDKLST